MSAWDGVPEKNLQEIVQYLKTFSPRWKEESPGEPSGRRPIPGWARRARGSPAGARSTTASRSAPPCHPAYAPRRYIYEVSQALTGNPISEFRDDMYGSVLKESDYGVKFLPPDFTRSELRSIRADHRIEDLYRVVASGVGGTAMPTWRGALPEADVWSLVHYVDALVAMKGTGEPGRLLAENLAGDAGWTPPPAQ